MTVSVFLPLLALLACSGNGDDTAAADDSQPEATAPDAPPLVVNELLARNDTANADEAGEFDDWVEIYNAGDRLVNFDGLYLTDDLTAPTKWPLPAGAGLDTGKFLLVWCDGAPEQGDNHASFKLSAASEDLAIFMVADGFDPIRVDGIHYEQQQADLSAARVPDGSDNWQPGQVPTPGVSNGS